MKLSEVKGEAAIDMLADLIEPAGEIMGDPNVADAYRNKSRLAAVKVAIKNHKKAVIEILAVLDGIPVEEYDPNMFSLPVKLLEILNDKELAQLFTLQGQTGDATSSVSASENTKDKKQ